MKIDLRAEYTDTKSVYVYTKQKNNTNYIYIIVSVKKQPCAYWGQGIDSLEKKAAAKPKLFLDNPRAMWFNIAEIVYTTDFKKSCKLSLIFERLKSSETVDT